MRFPTWVLPFLVLPGCYPVRSAARAPEQVSAPEVSHAPRPQVVEVPASPAGQPRLTSARISGISFEGIAFDSRNHRLKVADQAGGPGSDFEDAAGAARSKLGIAAINAGFFTPDGTPLGLVISSGRRSGTWNSASSLGSGIWYENGSGEMGISRRENLGRSAASTLHEAIQAGPMLVENGHAVSGLEATRTSARTLILWDGGTQWWIGRTPPCTLAELADAVRQGQPAGWKVRHALNLDGGRSADLWVSSRVSGGPLTRRSLWNRPVRNFLVLVPR